MDTFVRTVGTLTMEKETNPAASAESNFNNMTSYEKVEMIRIVKELSLEGEYNNPEKNDGFERFREKLLEIFGEIF